MVSLAVRYATTNSKVLSAEVVYCVVESATTNGEVKANGLAAFELGGESGHTVTVGICGMSASLQAELEMVFEIRATVTRTQDEQPENLLHPSDFCCWDWVSESCRADVFLTQGPVKVYRCVAPCTARGEVVDKVLDFHRGRWVSDVSPDPESHELGKGYILDDPSQ